LALAYSLWATALITALFLTRACDLDSFNVGWGDVTADHGHAVLWWKTLAGVAVCLVLTVVVGVVSRIALYSIAGAAALVWILALLGAHGPHTYRVILFALQLPGFFAAIMALGVHDGGRLMTWWTVSVNTILYAPIFFAIARRRAQRARAIN
jgi:hypothetical protein